MIEAPALTASAAAGLFFRGDREIRLFFTRGFGAGDGASDDYGIHGEPPGET